MGVLAIETDLDGLIDIVRDYIVSNYNIHNDEASLNINFKSIGEYNKFQVVSVNICFYRNYYTKLEFEYIPECQTNITISEYSLVIIDGADFFDLDLTFEDLNDEYTHMLPAHVEV